MGNDPHSVYPVLDLPLISGRVDDDELVLDLECDILMETNSERATWNGASSRSSPWRPSGGFCCGSSRSNAALRSPLNAERPSMIGAIRGGVRHQEDGLLRSAVLEPALVECGVAAPDAGRGGTAAAGPVYYSEWLFSRKPPSSMKRPWHSFKSSTGGRN
jgi:hypothetical protein